VPGLIVQVRKHTPELPADDYLQLLAVYREGQFIGFHEDGRDYGPNDVVRTIDSVFGGVVTFPPAAAFANVIGSTNDPKINNQTWLNLWYNSVGVYPQICTAYQFNGFACTGYLVGGHVVTGQVAQRVAYGSNSVYIFPICGKHNANDNVYMEALQYRNAVWLNNYLGQ
jgi:hypothetical protein